MQNQLRPSHLPVEITAPIRLKSTQSNACLLLWVLNHVIINSISSISCKNPT